MAGEATDVQGIAIGLQLETAGWSSGLARAKGELQGLIEAAQGISIGVAVPKGGRGATTAAAVSPRVSPAFSVTQHNVRDMRADINQTLRAQAQQGQAVGIPIKLGRIPWQALRSEIAAGIGVVPIKVAVAGITGGSTKLLSAMVVGSSGGTMGGAKAAIQSAAASNAVPIPKAEGGPVLGPLGRRIAGLPPLPTKVPEQPVPEPFVPEWLKLQRANKLPAKDWTKRGAGGDVGGQPYIVNELGNEMFVPDRERHLIPKHVFDQLPKRNKGGPVMIPGGERLWIPPEDGWIIPAHLVGQVPRRAKGTPRGPRQKVSIEEYKALLAEQDAPAKPQVPYQPIAHPGVTPEEVELAPGAAIPAKQPATPRGFFGAAKRLFGYNREQRLAAVAAATPRPVEVDRIKSAIMGGEEKPAYRRVYRDERGRFMRAPVYTEADERRFWAAQQQAPAYGQQRPSRFTGADAYMREMQELSGIPRVNETMRARMQEVQISAQARRGVTPRSLVSSMSEFFGGGGRGRATAVKEMQNLKAELESMVPRDLRGTTDAMEHWSQRVHETGVNLGNEQKVVQGLSDAHKTGTKAFREHTKEVQRWASAHDFARGKLEDATSLQHRFDEAAQAASGGIGRNFLSATVGIAAFQVGMQALSTATEVATKVASPLIDQVSGWGSTATRVTKELAKSAQETGNVAAAIAQGAGAGGLGAAGLAYVGRRLTAGVTAKAAGVASGQGMDLRRGAYGAGNVPTGLYGGYGGLFGGSFLASEIFGGGKGFLENIAGEAGGYRAQANAAGFRAPGVPTGQGGPRTAGQGENAARVAGGAPPRSPEQQTQYDAALRAIETEFADYNEALIRGSRYLGENTSGLRLMTRETLGAAKGAATWNEATSKLQRFADEVGGSAPDEVRKLIAAGGTIVDQSGKAITSAKDLTTYLSQAAQGTILPTAQEYAAQQKIALEGAQAIADAQRQMIQRIQIPGQLGMQLAAQPLLPAQAGIATRAQMGGRIGGLPGMGAAAAYVQRSVAETQRLQDEVTAAGFTAIREQRRFIEQNIASYGGVGAQPQTRTSGGRNWMTGMRFPTASSTGATAGQVAGEEFSRLVGNVTDSLDKGQQTVYGYGNAITTLNTRIASRQTALNIAQYSNEIRLLNRNITYAKGLVSGRGAMGTGGNLGAMERQQFTLSRAAESLGIALSQRQINFQKAIAGFQAPGITGQERAARVEEAKVEADYAQRQLDIQRQQFTLSGAVFNTQAQNQLTDLERQRSLSAQTFSVEQQTLADQKRISVLTVKQGQLQAKAQAIIDQAQAGFGGTLSAAGGYVSTFGNTIKAATDAIRVAIGLTPIYSKPRAKPEDRRYEGSSGLLGMTMGPTRMLVGEAQGEAVAILRNPRPMTSAVPAFGSGMTISMPITITGNTISNASDLHTLARAVGEEVERRLSQKASLLNAPRAA